MKAILNLILENQVVEGYNKDTGNCALFFFFAHCMASIRVYHIHYQVVIKY